MPQRLVDDDVATPQAPRAAPASAAGTSVVNPAFHVSAPAAKSVAFAPEAAAAFPTAGDGGQEWR